MAALPARGRERYSTPFNETPAQIQSAILANQTVSSTYAATLTVSIQQTPEPATLTMMGAGLIALAAFSRKYRKARQ